MEKSKLTHLAVDRLPVDQTDMHLRSRAMCVREGWPLGVELGKVLVCF